MRSPGSVPEEERTLTERASISIDDGIEYASQQLDKGLKEINDLGNKAIENGTMALSSAITTAAKGIVDFSKEKLSDLTEKASNCDDFKSAFGIEKDGESEIGLDEITKESEIKGLNEPDQLQEAKTVTMAEYSLEDRLGLANHQQFANLADKRQMEAEDANEVKMSSPTQDDVKETVSNTPENTSDAKYAAVYEMERNMQQQAAYQKQMNEEFEEDMLMSRMGGGMMRM